MPKPPEIALLAEDVWCPHCGAKAELRDSSVVYKGRSFGLLYVCQNYPKCDSYVGVHKGTNRPKGTLADRITREARVRAHGTFDQVWKNGRMSRSKAYRLLATLLEIPASEMHIGQMSVEGCEKIIGAAEKIIERNYY